MTRMHVLIVHAHMEPTSFTSALTGAAVSTITAGGHTVDVSDLYAMGFEAAAGRHDFTTVADEKRFHYQTEQAKAANEGAFEDQLAREQERVRRADVVIFAFPLWWGGPPAILKGWIDRVLSYGFAYVDGARFDTGHFKGKRGVLCVTTGGTVERFSDAGVYGPIEKVLWPLQRLTLEYMGMQVGAPFVAYGAPRVTDAERAAYLESWRARVREMLALGT
jgi:NAD(P)H dehydrogenase (quinone)